MKIKIYSTDFRDKDFWGHFDRYTALDFFLPDHDRWEERGIVFTVEDFTGQDRFQRSIRIFAEGPDQSLTELVLNLKHKY